MPELNLPNDHIAEISLIGTGGGYGESIVIHLGNQNWIIVDSCINPNSQQSLPLEYLSSINADFSKVKLIVCTHWHDDHIQGLSQLLKVCSNAQFSFARANDKKKFLRFVSLDYNKSKIQASASSTIEFNRCIDILNERKSLIKEATADKTLLSLDITVDIKSEVFSLSPSDYTNHQFDIEISTLIDGNSQINKKLLSSSPNARSVVLYLKLGTHRIILGADLEVSQNNNEGWINIIEQSQVIDKTSKSSLFKVPHHGSENGYHERIWIELLSENPTTTLTPWNRNKRLPDPNMLSIFCNHSESVFMTTPILNTKPKKRDSKTTLLIEKFNRTLREVKFEKGIIRSRVDLNHTKSNWIIDLFDNAIHVNKLSNNHP